MPEFSPSPTATANAIALLEQMDPTPAVADEPAESTPPAASEAAAAATEEATPAAAPSAGAEREARLAEQLKAHRERKLARINAKASTQNNTATIAAQEAALKQAQADFEKNPVAFIQSKGGNPAELFAKLAEAARDATSPEGKIKALQAHIDALTSKFEESVTTARQREQSEAQRQQAANRQVAVRAEEDAFIATFTPDKYPHARAYLDDDAEMRDVIHKVAGELRAGRRGAPVPFEDIAKTIEERAEKHYRMSQGKLAALQQGNGAATQGKQQPAGATKGNRASSTVSNDLASTTASNPSRRRTLAERQRDAVRMLSSSDAKSK